MDKVSVIVPVMNCGKYIDQCMDSLMRQTCKDYEVLLMVGQSEDDSLQKCMEWQKRDNRIIIVSRKDSSLGDARNYALNMARGKYVLYVDADDFIEPDYMEEMISPLERDDKIDITCCGYREFGENQDEVTGFMPYISGIMNSDFQSYLNLLGEKAARVWTKAYRREWLIRNGIEQFDGCCEDQAVKFMLAATVRKIYCIQKALYHYRIGNSESLVHTLKGNTDYPRSAAFGIEYLKNSGIYEKVQEIVKQHMIGVLLSILDKLDNHEKMIKSCKEFFEIYFPDILEDYQRYRNDREEWKDSYILFGAGTELMKVLGKIDKEKVRYIVDNNPELAGKKVEGIEIKTFSNLKNDFRPNEETVLITSYKYCQEMAHQLWDSGITGFWMARDMIDENFAV